MTSEFILRQGAGQKLEFAVNRNGCGAIEIEWLSTGNNFNQVAMLASGEYELKPVAKAVESFLEDMEPVTVDIDQSLNPSVIFNTSAAVGGVEGLWVAPDFAKILTLATAMPLPVSVTMKPRLLKKNANDSKIKDKLPDAHEHEPTAFVWMLATELMKVRAGKPSKVLAKGSWYLFYVAGLVVRVRWDSVSRKWRVDVWRQDGNAWRAGGVVFSSN